MIKKQEVEVVRVPNPDFPADIFYHRSPGSAGYSNQLIHCDHRCSRSGHRSGIAGIAGEFCSGFFINYLPSL